MKLGGDMPYKIRPLSKRRFFSDEGEKYTKGGSIRCQAVSRNVLKKRLAEDPNFDSRTLWPEYQCGNAARPGYYVCWLHGAGKKGGPVGGKVAKQVKDIGGYVKGTLADKYAVLVSDPEIYDQRKQVAILLARNAELLEDTTSAGLGSSERVDKLKEANSKLAAGDISDAGLLIREVLDSLDNEKHTWDEIRRNTETIKNLTKTEIDRQKEMRLMLSADQVMNKFEAFTDTVIGAIEKFVDDPKVQEKIYRQVVGAGRAFIGTSTVEPK